jgi:hypothetical protein
MLSGPLVFWRRDDACSSVTSPANEAPGCFDLAKITLAALYTLIDMACRAA